MMFYIFDKDSMTYKKVSFYYLLSKHYLLLSVLFLLGLFVGLKIGEPNIDEEIDRMIMTNLNHIKSDVWVDSVFNDYKKRGDLYLSRKIFKNTPLSGELLTLCARNTYDSTGILIPIELVLIQAQFESSMGLEGKSPKRNPFNVGEHDNGTTLWFDTTFDGVQAYYYLMANNYLRCKSVEELLVDFVNCNGRRYASRPEYENLLHTQYRMVKNWLDKNLN